MIKRYEKMGSFCLSPYELFKKFNPFYKHWVQLNFLHNSNNKSLTYHIKCFHKINLDSTIFPSIQYFMIFVYWFILQENIITNFPSTNEHYSCLINEGWQNALKSSNHYFLDAFANGITTRNGPRIYNFWRIFTLQDKGKNNAVYLS